VLAAAGIPAVVADQEIVAMDWLLSNSVGGIKVQVREEDADLAAEVLEEKLGAAAGVVSESLDEEELARQALAELPDEPAEVDEATADEARHAAGSNEPAVDGDREREEYARRLFLAAVFSIVFPPLWFYAFYLMLNATFGSGPLSDRGRRQLAVGAGLVLLPLLIWLLILGVAGAFADWLPAAW
jgi:hypothetical protein